MAKIYSSSWLFAFLVAISGATATCLRDTSAPTCAEGFTLTGVLQCVKQETQAPQSKTTVSTEPLACPRWFDLVKEDSVDKCRTKNFESPICHRGYLRSEKCGELGVCSEETEMDIEGRCVATKKTNATCPDNSVYKTNFWEDYCLYPSSVGRCPENYTQGDAGCEWRETIFIKCGRKFGPLYEDCVVSNATCPAEFQMINVQCEQNDLQCPHGSFRHGNLCISERYDRECPPDFRDKDDDDYAEDGLLCKRILRADLICDKGIFKYGACRALAPNCPEGYKFNRDKCVFNTYYNASCPNGGDLQKGFCVFGPQTCREGFTLGRTMCERIESAPFVCPDGYSVGEDRCERSTTELTCPADFTLDGSLCSKTSYSSPTCPSGFKLEGAICVCTTR